MSRRRQDSIADAEMTDLLDQLERGTEDSPIGDSAFPPDPSTPPTTSAINADKLLNAWVVMVDVQKKLICAIQKTERNNRRTRAHNVLTRVIVAVSVAVAVVVSLVNSSTNREMISEVSEVQAKVADDVASTLRAVRAVSGALGAKVEADTAMHPAAEEAAREKAYEAQAEALEAEQKVSDDPVEKQRAARELRRVKERARMIHVVIPSRDESPDEGVGR